MQETGDLPHDESGRVTNQDEIYPKKLRQNADLPVLMYGKGKPELFNPDADLGIDFNQKWQPFGPDYVPTELDWWWKDEPLIDCPNRRIAVVGARRCTREDKEKCIARVKRCGEDNPGAIIVSGGAKGIDGYAHTAAIKNGLRTIAFVGTGPDRCYPKEHIELFEQISEHGMILYCCLVRRNVRNWRRPQQRDIDYETVF